MKELNTFRQFLAEGVIKEDYENDYNSSSYDLVKDMTFEKVRDVIQYHKVDPSEVIADLISRFGLSAEFLSEGIIKEDYANSEEDFTDSMVMEKIKDIIKYHELDPSDVLEEIGQEFGIDFEFGAGNGRGSQEQEARIKAMQRGLGHS